MLTVKLRPGLAVPAAVLLAAAPAMAGPSPWDGGWGAPYRARDGFPRTAAPSDRDREGEVEVTRFVGEGEAAQALGKGPISVVTLDDGGKGVPGAAPEDAPDDAPPAPEDAAPAYGPPPPLPPQGASPTAADPRDNAAFEAAVIDQLVKAGYDTRPPAAAEGQVVELRIVRGIAQPAEAPHKPVSGAMEVGVSNRGSMVGMALAVDLTKPRKALLSTRLEARIRDRASGEVLWEGRAEIATRDGDKDWGTQAIAGRLAEALFRKFPGKSGESFTLR